MAGDREGLKQAEGVGGATEEVDEMVSASIQQSTN
jgi:hypothetical protein